MNDREKLIALIFNGQRLCTNSLCHGCEQLADHLIANGVVVREKGEWVGEADGYADGELVYDVWYCPECNHCIDDGTDDPSMLPNFCPNCGADMTGGERNV